MSDNLPVVNLPKYEDLITEEAKNYEQNAFVVLLNQPPPPKWLKGHPTAKIKNEKGEDVALPYLPIDKVEYLLTRMFRKWYVEILDRCCIANSVVVTVRVHVINPTNNAHEWNDGIGAAPIQTDKGKGAMDWNFAKSHGVQIAAPAAETYAIKDAAEKFGRIFGKDLARKDVMSYDLILKQTDGKISFEDLKELYELKKDKIPANEVANSERIINNQEATSYKKLHKLLQSL